MTSSGGGGDGGGMMGMMGGGVPMPGLPIAGQGGGVDPTKYGKFQNFLPDILAEGENPMATGLRPDMFKYRSPGGVTDDGGGGGGGGGGDVAAQIQGLRDELAKIQSGGGGMQWVPGMRGSGSATDGWQPTEQGSWQPMGGGVGTMGMGGGGWTHGGDYMGGYTGRDTYVTPQGLALSRNPMLGPQFKNPEGSQPGYAPATKWEGA